MCAALLTCHRSGSAAADRRSWAPAGGEGSGGRWWQPYTDALVHAALLALPWGGHQLMGGGDGGAEAASSLWEAAAAYMAARPMARQPGLAPFFTAEPALDDYPSQCCSPPPPPPPPRSLRKSSVFLCTRGSLSPCPVSRPVASLCMCAQSFRFQRIPLLPVT